MYKKIFLLFFLLYSVFTNSLLAQTSIVGAWQQIDKNGNTATMICAENYLMFAVYNSAEQKYVYAGGGSFQILKAESKTILSYKNDFYTKDSTLVGLTIANIFTLDKNSLTIEQGPLIGIWTRLEEKNNPSPIVNSLWRLRAKEDKAFKMQTVFKGPLKTLKLLSGEHFQWASFNIDTHQFFGTLGGTFSKRNEKYTEQIIFSSKSVKEIAPSFEYDCILNGKDWIHAGQNSTGTRIHEIWEKGY